MKICVLGLGYIGLPTGILLSTHGHGTVGIDIDKYLVETINKGISPFMEPRLAKLLKTALNSKKFIAKIDIEGADVLIIPVSTPLNKEIKMAELKYVNSAAEMISSYLRKDNLIILESTVPPGTSEELLVSILEKSGLKVIKVVENKGFTVKMHDPYINKFEYDLLSLEEATREGDCIVLITDHNDFKNIDPKKISHLMKNRNILDTRNIINLEKWKLNGFNVEVLGNHKEIISE